jgi:hypothetical protein
MSEIPIRDLRLDEISIAAQFFHERWRPNHIFYRNNELLRWMFHDSPAASQWSDRLTIKVAFDSDAIVGFFGYIPFFYNHYGKQQIGIHLSTWWVDPEYRRGTLGMRLLHELQHQKDFNICIAGMITPVAMKLYGVMRWQVVNNIPRWVLPLNQSALLKMLPEQGRDVYKNAKTLFEKSVVSHRGVPSNGLSVRTLSLHELEALEWDDIYWRTLAPICMSPARVTSALIWRYESVPIFRYKTLAVFRDGEICGLLVYRLEQVKDRDEYIMRIVDIVCQAKAVLTLLDALVASAQAQNVALVDFFCTHAMYDADLKKCGFINDCSPDGQDYCYPYLFQPLDVNNLKLNTAWWIKDVDMQSSATRDNFFLTKGDYEFDRPN